MKNRWNIQGDLSFSPRYNIAPSQSVPVIIRGDAGNEAKLMKWGLVPSWARDPAIGNRMINARAETLLAKPAFKGLVATRRCLIPADGFYEWRREGKQKIPVWIHLKNKEPFAFAGLWDCWRHVESKKLLQTFTIITTDPNPLLRQIHDRMPAICDRDKGAQWLQEPPGAGHASLAAILSPWPAELMETRDVSDLVNSPDNDAPECIAPLPPDEIQRGQLSLV